MRRMKQRTIHSSRQDPREDNIVPVAGNLSPELATVLVEIQNKRRRLIRALAQQAAREMLARAMATRDE